MTQKKIIFFIAFAILSHFSLNALEKAKVKSAPYKYDLAVCAIFQNEAPYLKEWIEYHKLIGAQHFYLFNNLSDDNYQEVLAPYIANAEVDLIEWNYTSKDNREWQPIQRGAYKKAIEAATGKARWLAIIDLDEFIVPEQTDNLVTFLADYEPYGGIIINWQMYGTSFVAEVPKDKLMIEMLTLKAPAGYPENGFVKSIVHPHRVKDCQDAHIMTYKEGFFQVNPNKTHLPTSKVPVIIGKIRINHYWSRDEAYFWNVKVPRRQKWREGLDGIETRLRKLNQVSDGTILRFAPALRQRMNLDSI